MYFTARDKVVLYPGFAAVSGSNFVAYLEPCSSTRWLTEPQPIMSGPEKGLRNPVSLKAGDEKAFAIANEKIDENVVVAPNPFNSSFVLTINSKKDGKADITIYNSFGVKIKQQPAINLIKGTNKIAFNCSTFAAGIYMVEINSGDSKVVRKIVKN